MKEDFSKNKLFSYNENKKSKFIFYSILFSILIIGFILFYVFKLRNSDFFAIKMINSMVKHVSLNILNLTSLGAFYTTAFGGLFFLPIPIELTFFAFIKSGNLSPIFVIFLFLLGVIISFTIDYWIGLKLNNISKRVIGFKKFYKMKVMLNKYGALAVFGFNVLPLPAQPFATLLGVFKYNKIKFYTLSILGQAIKLTAITLGYVYIF
jgi:membrane protein YqaA with SNARE-associated domain